MEEQFGERYQRVYGFLLNRWYIDAVYTRMFVQPTAAIGAFVGRGLDPEVVDGLVTGVSRLTFDAATGLRQWQTGDLRYYAMAILAGTLAVLLFVLLGVGR